MKTSTDQKIIELYKKTRTQQPSEAVEQRILQAAKNKIARKKSSSRRYIWAFSSVAIVVLSINVVLKLWVSPALIPPVEIEATLKQEQTSMDDLLPQNEQQTTELLGLEMTQIKQQEHLNGEFIAQKKLFKDLPISTSQRKKSIVSQQNVEAQTTQHSPFQRALSDEITKAENTEIIHAPVQKSMSKPSTKHDFFSPMMSRMREEKVMSLDQAQADSLPITLPLFILGSPNIPTKDMNVTSIIKQNSQSFYKENRLLLRLNQLNKQQLRVTAFRGSEVFGLAFNWHIKAEQLSHCRLVNQHTNCKPFDSLTVSFNQNKAVSISWIQHKTDTLSLPINQTIWLSK